MRSSGGLFLVALCALLAVSCTATKSSRKQQKLSPISPPVFSAGREYQFQYDAQTSSGFPFWISTQKAMSRLQAKVYVNFKSSSEAVLRMEECRMGQLNEVPPVEPWNPIRIQPIAIFESTNSIDDKFNEKLELPVQFSYEDGVVNNIRFHHEDQIWSKNIKKGLLNMLQLNLKPKQAQQDQNEQKIEQELRKMASSETLSIIDSQQQNTFSVTETGIEGECETTYSVYPAERQGFVSVSKSINFDNCKTLADISYGMQADSHKHFLRPQMDQRDRLMGVSPQAMTWNNRSIVERQILDRSTTLRYTLVDPSSDSTENEDYRQQSASSSGANDNDDEQQQQCPIREVELQSNYVLKGSQAESSQAMQTVIVAALRFVATKETNKEKGNKKNADEGNWSEAESLIYNSDIESQEQVFYMFGDESEMFRKRSIKRNGEMKSPFPINYGNSETKLQRVRELLRRVADANSDQFHDGENRVMRIAEDMDELVKVLRFCTVEELHQLQNKVTSSEKAQRWLPDALAAAGTRNTLKVLTETIQKGEFDEIRSSQLLKIVGRGYGLPAPSDRIADLILALCNSEYVKKGFAIKQACWLTLGSVVNEVQRAQKRARATENTLSPETIIPKQKIDFYKKVFLGQLKAASNNQFEKIVAIKTIGNSALWGAIEELQDIVNDENESPIVRINAIEAFRHAKSQNIRRALLPLFQNENEREDVRMAAFSVITDTAKAPSTDTLDQITDTLARESSQQVKAFVYAKLKALSESPVYKEQGVSAQLSAAIRLAREHQNSGDEAEQEELEESSRISSFKRLSLYDARHREGIFVDGVQLYVGSVRGGPTFPTHASISMDKLWNDEIEKDTVKLSVCQNGAEDAISYLVKALEKEEGDEDSGEEETEKQKQQSSAGKSLLQQIFTKLGIKSGNDDSANKRKGPHAIVSIRINNLDSAVIQIGSGEHNDGQQQSDMKHSLKMIKMMVLAATGAKYGKWNAEVEGIMKWKQRSARIPTSTGMELKIKKLQFSYAKAKIAMSAQGQSQINAIYSFSSSGNHIQKMKLWSTPVHGAGVKRVISSELKAPIEVTAQLLSGTSSNQKTLKLNARIPQEKLRLLAIHTLPMTFVTETSPQKRAELSHGERVKALENVQLKGQLREIKYQVGSDSLRLPLKIQGSVHKPRQQSFFSLKELLKVLYTAENHFHVDFSPIPGETPRELSIQFTMDLFRSSGNTATAALRPRLAELQQKFGEVGKSASRRSFSYDDDQQKFYSVDDDTEQNNEKYLERERKSIQNYMDRYSLEKAYKHSLKIDAETVGGSQPKRAEIHLDRICDAKFQTCEDRLTAHRSAMFQGETGPWTMEIQSQSYYPDTVFDVEDLLDHEQRNQKFLWRVEANWGPQKQQQQRQTVTVNVKGEPSREMLRRALQAFQDPRAIVQGLPQKAPTPFINKYTVFADYRLSQYAQQIATRCLETLKARNFMNTESRILLDQQKGMPSGKDGVSSGQIQAQIELEPSCHGPYQYANVTINTPEQLVRIESMELFGARVCPMKLVRRTPFVRPVHSLAQLLSSFGIVQNRGECSVDSQRSQVRTFDGSIYPMTLSDCYTVLAKDCQGKRSSDEEKIPRFAVLMKTVGPNGQKKLKLITKKRVVEVEPNPTESRKLLVKVDGKQYTQDEIVKQQKNQEQLQGIEFSHSGNNRGTGSESVTIDSKEVTVRFNGKNARIHLNGDNKRSTCGLCGNYDDDQQNDFKKPDGSYARKLSNFQRAYTLVDNKEGCTSDSQSQFFSKHYDNENSDENREQQRGNRNGNKKGGLQLSDNRKIKNQRKHSDPIDKTNVIEFNHKVCFSQKPVKQCPTGSFPDNSIYEEENKQPKQIKVAFTCLDRKSLEAKRLRKEVEKNDIAKDAEKLAASFTETVTVPERCVRL